MKTAILTTCAHSIDAHLLRSKLESKGIRCYLIHENFSNLMPHYLNMIGSGIQIIVSEKDLENAKMIVNLQGGKIVCPDCGSDDIILVIRKTKYFWIALIGILFAVPFGNLLNQYKCNNCKTEFKN